jgi:hypothetical protein
MKTVINLYEILTGVHIEDKNIHSFFSNGCLYENLDQFMNPSKEMPSKCQIVSRDFWNRVDVPMFFIVTLDDYSHFLIVETNGTYWKIFQSWKNRYTYADWIGQTYNKEYDNFIKRYGQYKKLTRTDLISFFIETNSFTDDDIGYIVIPILPSQIKIGSQQKL